MAKIHLPEPKVKTKAEIRGRVIDNSPPKARDRRKQKRDQGRKR